MATLSALQTRVKYNIGGRTDKDAVITDALNQAVEDIANSADWQDLMAGGSTVSVSLPANSYFVTRPAGCRKIIGIRLKDANDNWFDIEITGKARFRGLVPEIMADDTGIPSYCYLEDDFIYFDYKAQETYTAYLDVYKYPTEMVSSSDTPSIVGFDNIIVAQATGYVFASIKQVDMAAFWFAIADAKLKDKLDETRVSEVGQLEPW